MKDSILSLQPAEVVDMSERLEVLAGRIATLAQAEHANSAVAPPGRDEVSQTAAKTVTDVRTAFAASAAGGVAGFREISATLRAHAEDVASADQDFTV